MLCSRNSDESRVHTVGVTLEIMDPKKFQEALQESVKSGKNDRPAVCHSTSLLPWLQRIDPQCGQRYISWHTVKMYFATYGEDHIQI